MDMNRLPRDRRRDILRLARLHGVTTVRVYGSVARREAGPDSDLDLLVSLEAGRTLLNTAPQVLAHSPTAPS